MKLTRIRIVGFRGFAREHVLRLLSTVEASVCTPRTVWQEQPRRRPGVLGQWRCGLGHRDGVGMGALVHLLAAEAEVELSSDREAEHIVRGHRDAAVALGQSLTALAGSPIADHQGLGLLTETRDALRSYVEALDSAVAERQPLPALPPTVGDEVVDRARALAATAPAEAGPAQLRLTRLQGLVGTKQRAEAHVTEIEASAAAVHRAAAIADEHVDRAIDEATQPTEIALQTALTRADDAYRVPAGPPDATTPPRLTSLVKTLPGVSR